MHSSAHIAASSPTNTVSSIISTCEQMLSLCGAINANIDAVLLTSSYSSDVQHRDPLSPASPAPRVVPHSTKHAQHSMAVPRLRTALLQQHAAQAALDADEAILLGPEWKKRSSESMARSAAVMSSRSLGGELADADDSVLAVEAEVRRRNEADGSDCASARVIVLKPLMSARRSCHSGGADAAHSPSVNRFHRQPHEQLERDNCSASIVVAIENVNVMLSPKRTDAAVE